jgi:hypothetical protein
MNDLNEYLTIFDGITPFEGEVPPGYHVDFLGALVDARFKALWSDPALAQGGHTKTEPPALTLDGWNSEVWFEAVDWVVAAREARDRFVMVTLGAQYGAQAVGACRALQILNPMPYRLVAVEPIPEQVEWIKKHMRDNGIDPDRQWILPLALSHDHEPVFFPVGAPGSGSQNCFSTNELIAREHYVAELTARDPAKALRELVLHNRTGITKQLADGLGSEADIQLVSAVTLEDVLGPFDFVDFLEADIQESEILVFPPCIDLLRRKVRRIHIGTHGAHVHRELHELFARSGWELVFSYEPDSRFDTDYGSFLTNDGVLTVRNPDL